MKRISGLILVLLILASLALVILPMWLIRPFAPQTPAGLAAAYALRRWTPWATLAALAMALFLAVRLWRNARWWSRALVVLAFVPLLAAAWFSRQNLFETMFTPLGTARSVAVSEASWVEDQDPVMALALNGEEAAYPVRQVAYHHIVQDVVGGVPVAVTY